MRLPRRTRRAHRRRLILRPPRARRWTKRRRAATARLPRLVIPMLPEILSNGVCSLRKASRGCQVGICQARRGSRPVRTKFANTLIHSKRLVIARPSGIDREEILHPDGEEALGLRAHRPRPARRDEHARPTPPSARVRQDNQPRASDDVAQARRGGQGDRRRRPRTRASPTR